MTLDQIQATVVGIVRGIPKLNPANQPIEHRDDMVFANTGQQNTQSETNLKAYGISIEVSFPIGASITDQSLTERDSGAYQGIALLDTITVICVRTNPKVNVGENAKNLFVLVSQIIKEVLSWKPTSPTERGFRLNPERPFEPDFEDIGCETYDVRIRKKIIVS